MPLPSKRSKREPNYLRKIYLIYGLPKSGKTTIASHFGDDESNKVLFFATEPGHKFQEVYKWMNEQGEDPTSWLEFKQACKELAVEEHDFKCLVIDTADNLFKWCTDYILKKNKVEHESDLSFGKGYSLVREEFSKPLTYLAQKGMGLIFISHAQTKELDIGKRKISRSDTTLPNTAGKFVNGISDFIFYFYQDDEGRRFIRTKGTENVNAGDRSGKLPELIEYTEDEMAENLKQILSKI